MTDELLMLQLALECKGVDAEGSVTRIPGDEPDDVEPLVIAKTEEACRLLPSRELSSRLRESLLVLDRDDAFLNPKSIVAIAAADGLGLNWRRTRSFVAHGPCSSDAHQHVMQLGSSDEELFSDFSEPGFLLYARMRPIFAVTVDGKVVSACTSSRENERAAEAWVFTEPAFRGRGFARQVVAAWADAALKNGKVAFYSHNDENHASGGVVQRLDFEHWLSSVVFSAD